MEMIARLERLPVGRFHYKLLIATGLGWMFDAMDTGLIAFILPALAKAWGLTPLQMGLIGSMGLVGMAAGAVVGGFAADRFGRKKIFSVTLLIYSLATGLCGLAWNLESLLLFRFFVGFGLGGELPVAVTLMTEYAPPASRGRFIVLLESFWGLGWLAAALIGYWFVPYYGWQWAFFIGALPALYVLYIRLAIPESVRYLMTRGQTEQAEKIVSQLEQAAGIKCMPSGPPIAKARAEKVTFGELWRGGFAKRTAMLWLLWFGIVYSYYGIFTWLPSLMVGQGYTVLKSFESVLIMTLAQLPGYFSAAYLVERVGRRGTLAAYLSLSALCAYLFGQGQSAEALVFWGSWMSFFNLGAWGVLYTYTPELYPTRIRAFGSGWAAAIGRSGGVLAPMIVGMLVGTEGGFVRTFAMFTIVMLLMALLVSVTGEETKGKSLNSINE
ncbi:MAG TPA: MFS transporter [Patescibacteria group bacterium]|nr:MFS transporter [Patescibacteria group bacterium]